MCSLLKNCVSSCLSQVKITLTQQWIDNIIATGEVILKYKRKIKWGFWKSFWEQNKDKIAKNTSISSLSQADRYCDIVSAYNDGTLQQIYDEDLHTIPMKIIDIYSAMRSHKNKSKPKGNKKKKQPTAAQKQREKIKVYAKSNGYDSIKIPADNVQRKFIINLIEKNKILSEQVERKNKYALQQSLKITKLKNTIKKREAEYATALAYQHQLKQERDGLYRDQGVLFDLMAQKDSKISDLITSCSNELRIQKATPIERHVIQLMNKRQQTKQNSQNSQKPKQKISATQQQ